LAERKKRVRKHVIADLSVNHVEYHVLKAGYTMECSMSDYGYDGFIVSFDSIGEIENGTIFVQLKATDNICTHQRGNSLTFSVKKKDLDLRLGEPFPVYLILYDAQAEKAYWLYIQNHFGKNGLSLSSINKKALMVQIDRNNVYDAATPSL
jgi:hypothetical protein